MGQLKMKFKKVQNKTNQIGSVILEMGGVVIKGVKIYENEPGKRNVIFPMAVSYTEAERSFNDCNVEGKYTTIHLQNSQDEKELKTIILREFKKGIQEGKI